MPIHPEHHQPARPDQPYAVYPQDRSIVETAPDGDGTGARRVPTAWWALLWAVALVLVGFLVWSNAAAATPSDAASVYPEPSNVPSLQLELIARYTAGMRTSGLPVPQGQMDQALADLATYAVGPTEHVRLAFVLAAEAEPDRAMLVLDDAERAIEEALVSAAPADAPIAQVWADALREDVQLARAIASPDPPALTQSQLDTIRDRHGWFAVAASAAAQGEGTPAYDAYNADTTRVLIVGVIVATAVLIAFLVGVVLLLIAVILVATGRVRSGLNLRTYGTGVARAAAFEGFVLFLLGFVAVNIGLELLAASGWIASPAAFAVLQFVLLWSLLLVVLWPAARGQGWRGARVIAGWGLPKPGGFVGFVREVALGLVGYIAGLPIIAVGLAISLLLITLLAAEPSHPGVDNIRSMGTLGIVLIAILATVWAPVVEETVFRGMLYAGLRGPRALMCIPASLISGVLFAIIHPQGIALVPALASVGVVFALIREWRGTVLGCIAGHALHNGTIVTFLLLALA